MGREVRRVTKDWEHPKKDNGSYQPMFDDYYQNVLDEWIEQNKAWENGTHPDFKEYGSDYPRYAMWGGNPPDCAYYKAVREKQEDLTHIQMYEDTSEGTPISPVFEKPEDLARWLYDNKASAFGYQTASYEHWLSMINRGYCVSAVLIDGVVKSGVEAD